jgi:hypothetical protein
MSLDPQPRRQRRTDLAPIRAPNTGRGYREHRFVDHRGGLLQGAAARRAGFPQAYAERPAKESGLPPTSRTVIAASAARMKRR